MGRKVWVFGILGQIVWGHCEKFGVMLSGIKNENREKVGKIVKGGVKHLGGVGCG